jgi:hypothetical protein
LSVANARAPQLLSVPAPASSTETAALSAANDAEALPDSAPAGPAQGNVAELKQMVDAHKLTELRVTYNANYGASLFFYPKEVVYYVALFQDKQFWRVIKTQDESRADTLYAQFARKSYTLADGEIRRTQLQAQKALLERVIALSVDRASRLSADIAVAQAQDTQVTQQQQSLSVEAAALQSDKLVAEQKLRTLQQQIKQLQNQNEAGLPTF